MRNIKLKRKKIDSEINECYIPFKKRLIVQFANINLQEGLEENYIIEKIPTKNHYKQEEMILESENNKLDLKFCEGVQTKRFNYFLRPDPFLEKFIHDTNNKEKYAVAIYNEEKAKFMVNKKLGENIQKEGIEIEY